MKKTVLGGWKHAARTSAAMAGLKRNDRIEDKSEARPKPSMPKMPWDDEKVIEQSEWPPGRLRQTVQRADGTDYQRTVNANG
jgi:hypothetical protein